MRALRFLLVALVIFLSATLTPPPTAPTALAASSTAASQPASPSPSTLDLAGPWKFSTDREERGLAAGWQKPDFDASKWRTLNAPGSWEEQGITTPNPNWPQEDNDGGYNGYAWYRKSVAIPADWTSGTVKLHLGAIHDSDWTYVNGVQVGLTTGEDAHEKPREYPIPQTVLRPGKPNVIAIRVFDVAGAGGIYKGPVELTREVPGAAPTAERETPAEAQYSQRRSSLTRVGKSVEVPADMLVEGDAVSIGGSVTISGRVTGDAVAVGGSVIVKPGGRLEGDATSVGGEVIREGDALIQGATVETPGLPGLGTATSTFPRECRFLPRPFHGAPELLFWGFITLLAALLFANRLEVMARALPASPGAAALAGLVGLILTPAAVIAEVLIGILVIIILALTIVGILAIPAAALALVAALLAIGAIALIGMVAVALSVGRAILDRAGRRATPTLWAALLGVLILWIACLLPVIGPLVFTTLIIFGFGVAIITGVGTHERWLLQRCPRAPAGETSPPPPTPAPPPAEPTPPLAEPAAPTENSSLASPGEETPLPPEPTEPAPAEEGEAETRPEPPAI